MIIEDFDRYIRDNYDSIPSVTEPSLEIEQTAERSFDLMDKKDTIIQPTGSGCVTYINLTEKIITAFYLEKYLNQFSYQGKKCDALVLDSENSRFFILNELSIASYKEKFKIAKNQFHDSIAILKSSQEMKEFINSCDKRLCILSCRNITSTPMEMADPFLMPYHILEDAIPFTFKNIQDYDFDFYEASTVEISENAIKLKF